MSTVIPKQQLDDILDAIQPMQNNRLRNYIAPGLTSFLVGGGEFGSVRLFCAERTTLEFITPHSHRFDFTCLVLRGTVYNTIFRRGSDSCELWCLSTITQVCGKNGINHYDHVREKEPSHWYYSVDKWKDGDTYSMQRDQIHSIKFDRGSQVLFFEGPELQKHSQMLEPWEDGKVIPTFRTEDWMFLRD